MVSPALMITPGAAMLFVPVTAGPVTEQVRGVLAPLRRRVKVAVTPAAGAVET